MRCIFLLILTFIWCFTFAQHRVKSIFPKKPSTKAVLQNEIINECFFTHKYNDTQLLHLYPFNKAKSVLMISFKEFEIPVKNSIIDERKVLEKTELNTEQTDSLASIFYNVGFTPVNGLKAFSLGEANCYYPRNGILFLNDAGKAFEYLEICFSCARTRKSSNSFNDGQYCSTKFSLLRNLFNEAGIKYGTKEEDSVLSYRQIFKLDAMTIRQETDTVDLVSALRTKLSKKTEDSKDLSSLNSAERTLLLTINAEQIYRDSRLNGIADFYLYESGNYYDQTIEELKKIGANLTCGVIEKSSLQWPQGKIPRDIKTRRVILAKIINRICPKWKKLQEGLYDYQYDPGALTLIPKEDLYGLIFKFANEHRNELKD